jgi:uncharacterized iron-regulated protein
MIKKLLLLLITTYSFSCQIEINATIYPEKHLLSASFTKDGNTIAYEKKFPKKISSHFISLLEDWYPKQETLCHYQLHLTLPKSFDAISESDTIMIKRHGAYKTYHFSLPHPIAQLSIIASDRFTITQKKYKDITLSTYLLSKDDNLSKHYLSKSQAYIAKYEKEVGAFAYKRFSVVENMFQTGYSMPTFTLIGSAIIRKSFVLDNSLGHEIAHQWFGNSLFNDYKKGNWIEGLTTYLADHAYKGNQRYLYRKNILHRYALYVDHNHSMPLSAFQTRSDKATQAIGYGKGMMAFHMLARSIGEESFLSILKAFYHRFRFKKASYHDIEAFFEAKSQKNLRNLFHFLFETEQIIDLQVKDIQTNYHDNRYHLSFHLSTGLKDINLTLPLTIIIDKEYHHLNVENNSTITLALKKRPYQLTLDPHYDLFRKLSKKERLLTLSLALKQHTPTSLLKQATLNPDREGITIAIKKDLSQPKGYSLKIESQNMAQIDALSKRLSHYGDYQQLEFRDGKLIKKKKPHTPNGIQIEIAKKESLLKAPPSPTISTVINEIKDRDVLFVGEYHDNFSHHLNQLTFIKQLHEMKKDIVIGMEMFQRPFQPILDAYLAGNMSEKEFLKKSEYFRRWGYDYNLYKPIIAYAKTNHIPIVALNLEREITKQITKGGLASLSKAEQAKIPQNLDFSDETYKERLFKIFQDPEHFASLPPSHRPNLTYLYQSQILWDETMAESIVTYLKIHPQKMMIVLVGNGHIEQYVGIPNRVKRRMQLDTTVILQDYPIQADSADYFLSSSPIEMIKTPKLGVYLKEEALEVTKCIEASMAEQFGIKKGDTILSFATMKVKDLADLKLALYLYGNQKGIEIEVEREGKKVRLTRRKK